MEREKFNFHRAWLMLDAGVPVARAAWEEVEEKNPWDRVAFVTYQPVGVAATLVADKAPVVMLLLRDGGTRPVTEIQLVDVAADDWYRVTA